MEENNIKKAIAGISIMASVFLFMVIFKSANEKGASFTTELIPNLSKGAGSISSQSSNTVSGSFNPDTNGDIVYQDTINKNKESHYKAIQSEKLKNLSSIPDGEQNSKLKLKLEINENGKRTWKNVQWSWIDYNQGILYFHFKTIENGKETKADNFTGNYQLIFE